MDITPPPSDLDAEVDSLLGWVVREGATNVLRHAGGHPMPDRGHGDGDSAGVEVLDDGARRRRRDARRTACAALAAERAATACASGSSGGGRADRDRAPSGFRLAVSRAGADGGSR